VKAHMRVSGAIRVEPLPSEGKGHTFESCRVRHFRTNLGTAAAAAPDITKRSRTSSSRMAQMLENTGAAAVQFTPAKLAELNSAVPAIKVRCAASRGC
jgi:long-subunit acyl-CoA synthetase (AMP-forming)